MNIFKRLGKKRVSTEKLGEMVASLAFLRSYDFIEKEVRVKTDVPFMLPERLQYYGDLMYTCMMIHSLQSLPESVNLDNVATAAVIHIQINNLSYLAYVSNKNDRDPAAQLTQDYRDMFDTVGDALRTKSPFILAGVYRDSVVQNDEWFDELNKGLRVTELVTSWLSDAPMYIKKYKVF